MFLTECLFSVAFVTCVQLYHSSEINVLDVFCSKFFAVYVCEKLF